MHTDATKVKKFTGSTHPSSGSKDPIRFASLTDEDLSKLDLNSRCLDLNQLTKEDIEALRRLNIKQPDANGVTLLNFLLSALKGEDGTIAISTLPAGPAQELLTIPLISASLAENRPEEKQTKFDRSAINVALQQRSHRARRQTAANSGLGFNDPSSLKDLNTQKDSDILKSNPDQSGKQEDHSLERLKKLLFQEVSSLQDLRALEALLSAFKQAIRRINEGNLGLQGDQNSHDGEPSPIDPDISLNLEDPKDRLLREIVEEALHAMDAGNASPNGSNIQDLASSKPDNGQMRGVKAPDKLSIENPINLPELQEVINFVPNTPKIDISTKDLFLFDNNLQNPGAPPPSSKRDAPPPSLSGRFDWFDKMGSYGTNFVQVMQSYAFGGGKFETGLIDADESKLWDAEVQQNEQQIYVENLQKVMEDIAGGSFPGHEFGNGFVMLKTVQTLPGHQFKTETYLTIANSFLQKHGVQIITSGDTTKAREQNQQLLQSRLQNENSQLSYLTSKTSNLSDAANRHMVTLKELATAVSELLRLASTLR